MQNQKLQQLLGDGNSNIYYFHPPSWGRWTHFFTNIFQLGWLKTTNHLRTFHGTFLERNTCEAEALAKFPDDARGDAAVSVGGEVSVDWMVAAAFAGPLGLLAKKSG